MNTWNKVCRACLTTKESFTYFLHQNVSPETYWFCTSVQINENEDLPKSVCNSCYQLLMAYSEFKRTCIESQNTLLSCSNTKKSETEHMTLENIHESIENDELKVFDIFVKEEELSDHFGDEFKRTCIESQNTLLSCSNTEKSETECMTLENIQEPIENDELKDFDILVKEEELSDHFGDDLLIPVELSEETSEKQVKLHKRTKKLSKLKREVTSVIKRNQFLYPCELCNKKFRHHERFEAHKLEHDGKRIALRCQPCDKTFMTWSGLARHKESAHTAVSLASVSCRVCGRICKSRHTLRAHESAHGQRAACVCDVCGKRVTNDVVLRAHLETHKADRERRHTCEHCGKKFFTKTMLLSHISRQHSGRRYICEICNYPFTDKYNLTKHILKHEGKKSHKCDICEKLFATNSSLVEHKRIHSGERPFLCNYCPKRFLSKRRLTDHHRIHTGEKPHRCGVCDQRFTQRGTLQRHMKVHDKPAVGS